MLITDFKRNTNYPKGHSTLSLIPEKLPFVPSHVFWYKHKLIASKNNNIDKNFQFKMLKVVKMSKVSTKVPPHVKTLIR